MASDLDLAPGTVMRAYRELETSGLILTGRGQGTVVTPIGTDPSGIRIAGLADQFVANAVASGARPTDIRAAIEAALSKLNW